MTPESVTDSVLQARRNLTAAKSTFSKAAVAALKGAPGAVDHVSQALREIDRARAALRTAERAGR